MTSIFKTPHGEMNQFIQNLHTSGFTYEDLVRVNRNPALAGRMHSSITSPTTQSALLRDAPLWYVSPVEQLKKVEALNYKESWGFTATDIPWGVPTFTPRTETEVLMLNVCLPDVVERQAFRHPDNRFPGFERTFLALWSLIQEPAKQDVQRMANTALARLGLPPRYNWNSGLRWVAFDPSAYKGFSAARALRQAQTDGVRVAGTEVLTAMVLFPDWLFSWDGSNSLFPKLSGIQFDYLGSGGYEHTPYMERQMMPTEVILDVTADDAINAQFCSPTIREL